MRAFSLEGHRKIYSFDLEQVITFQEKSCSLDYSDPSKRNHKLISARNYITYDEDEQVGVFFTFTIGACTLCTHAEFWFVPYVVKIGFF